ncbi:hypothetical protein [Paraburkholderia nemoris]|uniref:hypothetical protein n=1 Tax=Paraburkholderia nemoris TaxID=2793076 RepID=UPI001B1457B9|nr:hypothetical protein [Paraburkholderia nemoris]CAE6724726.1 hypothetical protein LMG22931_01902 [Paraburkholderia nemoris]
MTDFADAFNRGQAAAVLAAQARAQVDEVFASAKQQLLEATNGRLELERRQFEKPRRRTAADMFGVANIENMLNPIPREMEPWIAARNPTAVDSEWVKLAKWERPQEGFPCLLSYDKRDVRCHDQESLAEAIAELLANAWVGERLRELLDRPEKTVEDDSSGG